jgi:hypothetical protein
MAEETRSSQRIAVLVIHGMGEQAPYQTLDNFARGLASALRGRSGKTDSYKISFNSINHSENKDQWTEARVELEPGKHAPQGSPSITVAEYYWSPKAEDKMPWKDTLKWLALSDLSPLSHMAANVQEIWGDLIAAGATEWNKTITAWRAIKILVKEVFRALCIYLPLLLVVYWMLQWLGGGIAELFPQTTTYQNEVDQWLTLRHILLGLLGVVILDLACFLFTEIVPNAWRQLGSMWAQLLNKLHKWLQSLSQQQLVALIDEPEEASLRSQNDMVWLSRRVWICTASVLLAALAGLFQLVRTMCAGDFWETHILRWQLLIQLLPSAVQHWILAFLHWLTPYNNWLSLVFAAIAALAAIVLRNFLANYMGKVAIYVNTDANSKNYVIRNAILQGSCDALNRLLDTGKAEPQYDRVYVAAHSLGTAIALDTINELLTRAEAELQNHPHANSTKVMQKNLHRLSGLLTFGSPLNKIWYFFREQTDSDEAIRAQILSRLHSFRRVSSGRDYKLYPLSPETKKSTGPENPDNKLIPKFLWVNVIAWMDTFTGPLRFNPDAASKQTKLLPPLPNGLPKDGSLTLNPSDEGFYWVDRQYKGKLWRYWKPVLAHNTYWDDPCLYERFLADFNI